MTDAYVGTIQLFSGNFTPQGWAFCDGQILEIMKYSALFSIFGTQYGGDGRTTFALPKLSHDTPGIHYIICVHGVLPSRN